jgi:hypothetical protein
MPVKHLLSGLAVATALSMTAPVWAQTSAPTAPTPSPGAAASGPMAEEPAATSKRHHRQAQRRHHATQRHASRGSRGSRAPSDNMANQLNAEELSRSQGGVGGSMPPPNYGQQPVSPQMQGVPQQGGVRPSGR